MTELAASLDRLMAVAPLGPWRFEGGRAICARGADGARLAIVHDAFVAVAVRPPDGETRVVYARGRGLCARRCVEALVHAHSTTLEVRA